MKSAIAVSAMVNSGMSWQSDLTTKDANEASEQSAASNSLRVPKVDKKSISDRPAASIDDCSSLSVGVVTAFPLGPEPEKERWRNVVWNWCSAGLLEQPGNGKLHHHLGLLSREVNQKDSVVCTTLRKGTSPFYHPVPQSDFSATSIYSTTNLHPIPSGTRDPVYWPYLSTDYSKEVGLRVGLARLGARSAG